MATVGVRELKNRLSHYLALVKEGEQVTVTERGQEVAVIMPSPTRQPTMDPALRQRLLELVAEGFLTWNGGKPSFPVRPIPARGKPASEMVIEDRR
ncbi:MAG: type II toxin-antitoxin system Phd/YefM family antitoxin [Chloroflexota bacterium]